MAYFIDSTDDVLAFDGIRSFTGGQASGLQSDLLAENQVQELVNMTLSPKGSLETRLGITSFCTTATSAVGSVGGMRYFDTASYEYLINVAQGRFYNIDNNGVATQHPAEETWANTTSTFGTTSSVWSDAFSTDYQAKVSMAQFNDKMYLADSDGGLSYFDGNIVNQQAGTVRAITVTSGGTGYTTATAIVTGPNIEGTFPTLITTVAGGVVTGVVVSEGGSGYLSAPTVTILGDGVGATATATCSPPPQNLRILINTNNRLLAVGSGADRNTLYCSDILNASVWDSANSIVVNGDDGDEIVAVVPYYQNRVIVFKKRRIFQITIPFDMTSAADWVVSLISNNIGCAAENSAVQLNSDIFFLADDGIRSLVRSAADDFTSVGLPISEVIKDVIQNINSAEIGISFAAFYNNRYMLAVPTAANDTNDTIIVYNAILNAFEGTWSPDVMQFALTNFDGDGIRLMFKDTLGLISEYNAHLTPGATTSDSYKDNGSTYVSSVRTKDFNFGDPFAGKSGSHFEVTFDDSFSTDTTIAIQRDIDVGDIDVQPNINISSTALTLPFVLPAVLPSALKKRLASDLRSYEKWRLLNFKVTSQANKMAVRQIMAAANPDTIQVEKTI